MLRIYPVMLKSLEGLRPVLGQLERRDPDLARQLRRAASSSVLNVAEGMYSRGKNRTLRYHTALGSARETLAALEIAQSLHGLPLEPKLKSDFDIIIGTLVRLVA